ncbi:MAG: TonB family protein [Sphingomonas sp.]|uniref:TonB family protein n=1 Tax=Sphingomonas sp. TaxID=28214 RepID=UPI0025F8DACA|nr:TonB family protein [Sphingomonas sp.]MBQ1499788.1 TonB family protein [Sphingomonas sp.]
MLLVMLAGLAPQDAPRVKPLNVQEWVTEDDYPADALRYDEEGTVRFDLTVARDGAVGKCEIAQSSGSDALDATTCTLLTQRARFSTPQAGLHYRGQITWKLPPAVPEPIAWSHSAAIIRLAGDGAVLGCEEKYEGHVSEKIGEPCASYGKEMPAMLLAAIGGTGAPRTVTMELTNYFGGEAGPARFHAKAGQVMVARRQIQFDIAESGKVENCRDVPTGQEGVLDFMPSPCSWGPGPYVPPLDAAGKPHATTGTMEVAISRTP